MVLIDTVMHAGLDDLLIKLDMWGKTLRRKLHPSKGTILIAEGGIFIVKFFCEHLGFHMIYDKTKKKKCSKLIAKNIKEVFHLNVCNLLKDLISRIVTLISNDTLNWK